MKYLSSLKLDLHSIEPNAQQWWWKNQTRHFQSQSKVGDATIKNKKYIFLGLAGYYYRFIVNSSNIAAPISDLTN